MGDRSLTMKGAIIIICEGASGTLRDLTEKWKTKSALLAHVTEAKLDLDDTADNTFCDQKSLSEWRDRVAKFRSKMVGQDATQEEKVAEADMAPKEQEAKQVEAPVALASSFFSGFLGKADDAKGEPDQDVLTSQKQKGQMLRDLGRMEVALTDEIRPLTERLLYKQTLMKSAKEMFYGAVDSNTEIVCSTVSELAKTLDKNATEAAIALQFLLLRLPGQASFAGSQEHSNLWGKIKDWENFELKPLIVDLLQAKCQDFTEIDVMAMEAAGGSHSAIEHLRQLLCVNPQFMPYSMRQHLQRAIVKNAKPFVTDPWASVTRPEILRTLLHIVRNSVLAFLEAKEEVELYEHDPLNLARRKAIIRIGEMASRDHELAFDYLVQELLPCKDWSTRQLALSRAALVIPFVDFGCKQTLSVRLLTCLFDEKENPTVRETAETVLLEALKQGLNKDNLFVHDLKTTGNGLCNSFPTPRNKAAWQRITNGGLQNVSSDKHGKHQRQSRGVICELRQELYDKHSLLEKKELTNRR